MGAARLLECTTVRTISGRVKTRRVAFAVTFLLGHLGCGNWRKKVHVVHLSPVMNVIDMLLL